MSSCETRRTFLRLLAPRIIAAEQLIESVLTDGVKAEVQKMVTMCLDPEVNEPLIEKACGWDILPEEKLWLLEGLRSLKAFKEFAPLIAEKLNLNGGSLKLLYPGAGSHIAPIITASELINSGKISSAEYTFTDVSQAVFFRFIRNLKHLAKLDPNFKFVVTSNDHSKPCKEGTEYSMIIEYKDKPIKLNYLISYGGDDWFRQNDFENTDVFIQHDPAAEIFKLMSLTYQFLKAQVSSKKKTPLLVMEDTRTVLERDYNPDKDTEWRTKETRQFDLELLGRLTPGTETYGHRYTEWVKLRATINRRSFKDEFEVADPYFNNGVLLEIYPELLELQPEHLALLIDISILANNEPHILNNPPEPTIMFKRVSNGFKEGEEGIELKSPEFYSDLTENGEILLKQMLKINPKLATVLAFRMLLAILKITNEKVDNKKLKEFFKLLCTYLSDSDKNELNEALKEAEISIDCLNNEKEMEKYRYDPGYYEPFYEAVRKIEKYSDKLIQI